VITGWNYECAIDRSKDIRLSPNYARGARVLGRILSSVLISSHHITSHRIASHRIVSHHIASHCIVSNRIALGTQSWKTMFFSQPSRSDGQVREALWISAFSSHTRRWQKLTSERALTADTLSDKINERRLSPRHAIRLSSRPFQSDNVAEREMQMPATPKTRGKSD